MSLWKKVALLVALLVGAVTGAVVSAPAWAGAALTCQTRTWTSNVTPADAMYYNTDVSAWRWGYWQVSYCRHGIRWDPQGWRYERNGNVDVRVRFLNSSLHTIGVTSWVHAIGSSNTVTVAGFVEPGTWFAMEFRPLGTPYPPGPPGFWPIGQVEF